MERVGAYITRLQQQYQQQADKSALLITVQMLLAELQKEEANNTAPGKVAVVLPYKPITISAANILPVETIEKTVAPVEEKPEQPVPEIVPDTPEPENQPKPQIEPPVKEPPVEVPPVTTPEAPMPQPIKEDPAPTNIPLQTNLAFNVIDDVPTLMHYQPKVVYELNQQMAANEEQTSVNDRLKTESKELAHKLQGEPIRDLKKAIGINDRYLFLNELFRGDETMYERSIKTINNFNILPEAEYWMQRELKYKLGWDENSATVKHFNQLVKRRFS